jgi:glycosyltransferase involved in cell wall biosynthesis
VVVFRTGGCPEAITQECGAVVDKGDLDALCVAVRQVCANSKAYRDACLERSKQFDCEDTFRAYLALYKELCS